MKEMVREDLIDKIIKENTESLRDILDMPHGGTLPPDELSEFNDILII